MTLPRDRFIVITGLSGSGKSSLAFDTIYAEGQRRYVESLSAYARQFLGQMDKPDVDAIEGLSPAISIDQKTTSRNPRSTVGTVTEIYDYLRLLYARIGHPHCPNCGRPIAGQSVQQIVDQVCELDEGSALQRGRPAGARPQGRVRQALPAAARRRLHARQGRRPGARARRADRPRQEVQARHRRHRRPARDEGRPAAAADRLRRDRRPARRRPRRRRARRRPDPHLQREVRLRPLRHLAARDRAPRVLVQQPARRLPGVPRPRAPRARSTPASSCRTARISIAKGALLPYGQLSFGWIEQVIESIAATFEVDVDVPWDDLPEEQQDLFLYGTGGRAHPAELPQLRGQGAPLQRRLPGPGRSPAAALHRDREREVRQKIEEYMSDRVCPECKGARLKPTSLAVTRRRPQHPRVHPLQRARGGAVPARPRAHRHRAPHRRPRHQGDRRAPAPSSTTSASGT